MLSLEEIRKRKTPNTDTVPMVLNAEWGAAFAKAQAKVNELAELGMGAQSTDEWARLTAELERMRNEAHEHTVDMTLRSVSNDRYMRLVAAHPATSEQRRTAKDRGQQAQPWNIDTFPAALLAATVIDPDTGEALAGETEWFELWHADEWNTAELADLFDKALEVCNTRKVVHIPR